MVYGSIQRHSGVIEVDSEPGSTCFNIYLPLIEEQEEASSEITSVFDGGGEKILLVDDDGSIREITSEILTSMNYTVVEASDGEQAVKRFLESPYEYSLVILDVVMPIVGGVEAAKMIRMCQPNLPLIFMTGYGEQTIDSEELNMDAVAVISKPCSIPTLSQTINKLLQ